MPPAINGVETMLDVIGNRELIFLSPHYDDVPFIWHGLLTQVRSACPKMAIRIVNVFSRSVYQAHDDQGNRQITMKRLQFASGVRLLEDLCCLDDMLGRYSYRYELLGEDECITRQKPLKEGEAMEFPAGTPADFDVVDRAILQRLTDYCRTILASDSVVFGPLGIKNHIDHVLVREALLAAVRTPGQTINARVVFGEDLPYMGLANDAERRETEAILAQLPYTVIDIPVDAVSKCEVSFRHYVSQVEESYRTGVVTRARELQGHERSYLLHPPHWK